MTTIKKQSNGTTGEQAAEWYFKSNGLAMFRHQPRSKVIKINNKLTVVYERSDGISDYTGYISRNSKFIACEVKEAKGNTMPCSRLDKHQRDWMNSLPEGSAYVGVCWVDHPVTFQMFPYKMRGSYKRRFNDD